jgi:catechol-2,3-dioxygenase
MPDHPKLFRVMLEVAGLDRAAEFYSKLLGFPGRPQMGARVYFDCGPVILALVDVAAGGAEPKPNSTDVYFSTPDLESVHQRAQQLGCLSKKQIHGASAGEIAVRPWRERSFYVHDLWGNGLCFVDSKTLFTGA